jgi:hypothetical protein
MASSYRTTMNLARLSSWHSHFWLCSHAGRHPIRAAWQAFVFRDCFRLRAPRGGGSTATVNQPQYPPAMASEPPAMGPASCERHPFTRRSSSRRRLRALCNWDFELPIEHPKIWAISLCS